MTGVSPHPPGRRVRPESASGAGVLFALAGAKCERRLPARRGPAPEVRTSGGARWRTSAPPRAARAEAYARPVRRPGAGTGAPPEPRGPFPPGPRAAAAPTGVYAGARTADTVSGAPAGRDWWDGPGAETATGPSAVEAGELYERRVATRRRPL
ncbi:hypothetical protein GCM10010421_02170 [Streptomyces glaucus]|uniref:Secreted protein n=1 Tax=Streptomyces glaucus TaxID=284029 RepID=A0ABN3J2A4_9ACTN